LTIYAVSILLNSNDVYDTKKESIVYYNGRSLLAPFDFFYGNITRSLGTKVPDSSKVTFRDKNMKGKDLQGYKVASHSDRDDSPTLTLIPLG
jgi:hypothetical protein